LPFTDTEAVCIPLTKDSATYARIYISPDCRQFDTLLASYESLAQTTLFTLHLELRCHVIYFLDQAIREGNFGLTEDEVEEEDLDPAMVELCKDLVLFEQLLSATLESEEYTSDPALFQLPQLLLTRTLDSSSLVWQS